MSVTKLFEETAASCAALSGLGCCLSALQQSSSVQAAALHGSPSFILCTRLTALSAAGSCRTLCPLAIRILAAFSPGCVIQRHAAQHAPGSHLLLLQVVEETVADDDMIMIKGCKNTRAVTVLLRGANDYMLDEMDRSLHDAFCIVKRVLESGKVVPGALAAGCCIWYLVVQKKSA